MEDRCALLERIRACDFALDETALFLDTHPDCEEALQSYCRHLAQLRELRERYTACFGPLTADDDPGGSWRWICGPWPWELA